MNEKDHYLYSDKLSLGVVDLKHIELATEEDSKLQEQDKLLKEQENEIERLKALLATPTV